MYKALGTWATALVLCQNLLVNGLGHSKPHPGGSLLPRVANGTNETVPIVDLGYATYQGYYDAKFNTNVYKG